jgi:5-oxoprolinase (ATP-hydrolysing) subunit A
MTVIDLNCDLGESFGAYVIGDDANVLPHITSANIACGFHGGDPGVMRRTVQAAVANNVAIGAHPGLPDLAGFGRREMGVTAAEVYEMVVYQIGALQAIAISVGAPLRHVKPHGALYNMAAKSRELADAIAQAVRDVDPTLRLFGLAGSSLIDAGRACGLAVAQEVFADRNYRADGALVPRSERQAVLTDIPIAVARAVAMVESRAVTAIDGTQVALHADTICIHGDQPHAALLARSLRTAFANAAIDVRALHSND